MHKLVKIKQAQECVTWVKVSVKPQGAISGFSLITNWHHPCQFPSYQ